MDKLVVTIAVSALGQIEKPIIAAVLKNKLVREFGEDVVSRLLKQFDDVTDLGKYIRQLKKPELAKR